MKENEKPVTVTMRVAAAVIPTCFTFLFSRGVRVSACLACSIKELICQQLGLAEDYLENRVQTVFLDGHPVDDVSHAVVGENATVALSAAMPGLAGAVLRKGGVLATLRQGITYRNDSDAHDTCEGRVTVKLFNMTTREVGPLILRRGIWTNGAEFKEVVKRCDDTLLGACHRATSDGQTVDLDDLCARLSDADAIFLQVDTPS